MAGLGLAVAAVITFFASATLDLGLDGVVVLGLATGALLGLAPDGPLLSRLGAFAGGFLASFLAYFFRAWATPDTTAGQAVSAAVLLGSCALVMAASGGRLPLWAVLVGAVSVAGAFETTFADAPTMVVDEAVSTAASLLVTSAIGLFVAVLAAAVPDTHGPQTATDADGEPPVPVADRSAANRSTTNRSTTNRSTTNRSTTNRSTATTAETGDRS